MRRAFSKFQEFILKSKNFISQLYYILQYIFVNIITYINHRIKTWYLLGGIENFIFPTKKHNITRKK
jgi:hypothetical protein